MKKLKDLLDTSLNIIEKSRNGNIFIGFKTGWEKLDKVLGGGIRVNTNITIAARTSTGKSSFANALLLNILNNNKNIVVIYWNWEMTDYQQVLRLISNKSSLEVNSLLSQTDLKLQDSDIENIKNINKDLAQYNVFIEDIPVNVDLLVNKFIDIKNEILLDSKLKDFPILNIFDHTRLVLNKNNKTEEEKIHKLFEKLQELKKLHKTTNIIISQLNREIEKDITKNKIYRSPNLSDIFGADAVAQYSETVLMLHRPELYDLEHLPKSIDKDGVRYIIPSKNKLLCLIAKNRDGRLGEIIFEHQLNLNQITEWNQQKFIQEQNQKMYPNNNTKTTPPTKLF